MQNRMYGYNFSKKVINEIEEVMENLLDENNYSNLEQYITDVKNECELIISTTNYNECIELIENMATDFWNGEYELTEGKSNSVY